MDSAFKRDLDALNGCMKSFLYLRGGNTNFTNEEIKRFFFHMPKDDFHLSACCPTFDFCCYKVSLWILRVCYTPKPCPKKPVALYVIDKT
jgi:hypothetical protein